MILLDNGTPLYFREDWGADTEKWRWNNGERAVPIMMDLPVGILLQHHSVTDPTDDMFADVKTIERIGLSRFGRFSYSYAWHPLGAWFQGCGDWIGAHTSGYNSKALAYVLIGNYEVEELPDRADDDVRVLVDWLEKTKRLQDSIYPSSDHQGAGGETACSGRFARRHMPAMRVPWAKPNPIPPLPPISVGAEDMQNMLISIVDTKSHFLLRGTHLIRVEDHESLTSLRQSGVAIWEVTEKQFTTLKAAYTIVDK